MNERVVEAAREWLGTPYLHQASRKGVGCDCLGLIRGVWRELHGAEPEKVPSYTPDWSEPQRHEALYQAACRHMTQIPEDVVLPGQVLLFRMRKGAVAKHLGICSQGGAEPRFIHAYSGHCVTESPLSAPWRRRIVARFELSQG